MRSRYSWSENDKKEARANLNEKLPTSGFVVIDLPIDGWSDIRPREGTLERFITPGLIAGATE